MRVTSALALIAVAWIAAFVALNWQVLSSPVKVQFLLATFDTSIGMLTIALCSPPILVLLVYLAIRQGAFVQENRRQAKELQAQRSLAESAEMSRITELGTRIHDEIAGLDQRLQVGIETVRGELRDTERSIAATLAEMDDRMRLNGHPDTPT